MLYLKFGFRFTVFYMFLLYILVVYPYIFCIVTRIMHVYVVALVIKLLKHYAQMPGLHELGLLC